MTSKIKPSHYRGVTSDGIELQAVDVGEAFDLNHRRATAVEYIIRAGKKPGEPAETDIAKAIWWLNRELDRLAVKAAGHVPGEPDSDDREAVVERLHRIAGTEGEEAYARELRKLSSKKV
jgi:hypothetical protein